MYKYHCAYCDGTFEAEVKPDTCFVCKHPFEPAGGPDPEKVADPVKPVTEPASEHVTPDDADMKNIEPIKDDSAAPKSHTGKKK